MADSLGLDENQRVCSTSAQDGSLWLTGTTCIGCVDGHPAARHVPALEQLLAILTERITTAESDFQSAKHGDLRWAASNRQWWLHSMA
jgi:hypothetical protein